VNGVLCHVSKKVKNQPFLFMDVYCLILKLHLIFLQVSYLVMFAYISLTLGDTPQPSSFYISSKVQFQGTLVSKQHLPFPFSFFFILPPP
jgi:hypothetical protein